MIQKACSGCGQAMQVPETLVGVKLACLNCGQPVDLDLPAVTESSAVRSSPFAGLNKYEVSFDPVVRTRMDQTLRKRYESIGLKTGMALGAAGAIVLWVRTFPDLFFWLFTGGGIGAGLGEVLGGLVAVMVTGTPGWTLPGALWGILYGAARSARRGALGGAIGGMLVLGVSLLLTTATMLFRGESQWKLQIPMSESGEHILKYGWVILAAAGGGMLGALAGAMIGSGEGIPTPGSFVRRSARRGAVFGVAGGLLGSAGAAWLTVLLLSEKAYLTFGGLAVGGLLFLSLAMLLFLLAVVGGALIGAIIGGVLAALGGAWGGGIIGAVGGYKR